MKTRTWSGVALALGVSLAAAGVANAQAVKVDDLAARWTAAYNQKNADAVAALYSDNAELYVHGDDRFVGRPDIRAYWAKDMTINSPLTVLTVTDSVVDAEMVLVHGNYQVLDRNTGVPQGHGRFAHIWIREPSGQWKLDRDLWNQPVGGGKP